MFYPDINAVKKLTEKHNVIPISMEVYADMETPISLFKRFEDSTNCFLLESVEGGEKWARYSFIGKNPFLVTKSYGDITYLEYKDGKKEEIKGNPINTLKELMSRYDGADLPEIPRFNGGAVGYFGYDLIRHFEKLPNMPEDDLKMPESHFMFMDEVLSFDHLKQKVHIIVNLHRNGNLEKDYAATVQRIKEIYEEMISSRWKINDTMVMDYSETNEELKYTSNITKEQFCKNVEKAKEYIRNGDIFQVVPSQRLAVKTDKNPFDVYRVLRVLNPSPYMYHLKFDDYNIVGASPEMLVRVENGFVETCPIAGTRKRGSTKVEDLALENELLADEKEKSEHTMLVDLGRNDIGRVSKYGSVKVKDFMHIEKYSHVMHMVSNVIGELNDNTSSFDALMSVLPAGTLSGAPKIRAMEIIDELETVKRGIYGGAIGYLSFNGIMDSCITIRTLLFKDGMAYVQAGGGVVADSVPELEYEESINKAKALLKALEKVGGIK